MKDAAISVLQNAEAAEANTRIRKTADFQTRTTPAMGKERPPSEKISTTRTDNRQSTADAPTTSTARTARQHTTEHTPAEKQKTHPDIQTKTTAAMGKERPPSGKTSPTRTDNMQSTANAPTTSTARTARQDDTCPEQTPADCQNTLSVDTHWGCPLPTHILPASHREPSENRNTCTHAETRLLKYTCAKEVAMKPTDRAAATGLTQEIAAGTTTLAKKPKRRSQMIMSTA